MPDTLTFLLVGPLVEESLLAALPWLSVEGRRLVAVLVACNGRVRSMHSLTEALGLRDRHQLTRLLAREHLPALECLTGWIRILVWITAWERHRTPLAFASLNEGHDPAIRFRTVKRVAGCTWGELKRRGSVWVLLQFQSTCMAPAARRSGSMQSA